MLEFEECWNLKDARIWRMLEFEECLLSVYIILEVRAMRVAGDGGLWGPTRLRRKIAARRGPAERRSNAEKKLYWSRARIPLSMRRKIGIRRVPPKPETK